MNGFEFLKKYSEEFDDCSILITMITSSLHDKDKEQAMSYEFVKDFFMKPLTADGVKKLAEYVKKT